MKKMKKILIFGSMCYLIFGCSPYNSINDDISDVCGKTFVGVDIAESDLSFYLLFKECVQSSYIHFYSDGSYIARGTKDLYDGSIIEGIYLTEGLYIQKGNDITITATKYKNNEYEWVSIPEEAQKNLNLSLNNDLIICESYHFDNKNNNMIKYHIIYKLSDY